MRHAETALRLRIIIGEDEKYKGRPLFEEVIVQAQQSRLAGATVFRGYLGYGAGSGLNTGKLLRTSKDLPVIIEILDSEIKINAFMEILDQLLKSGVATVEKVQMYRFTKS